FYELLPNNRLNLMAAIFTLMLAYLQYQYYFVNNYPMNALLDDVLKYKLTFFLWPHYKGRNLTEHIRQLYLTMLNISQSIVLSNCKFFCFAVPSVEYVRQKCHILYEQSSFYLDLYILLLHYGMAFKLIESVGVGYFNLAGLPVLL